MKVQMHLCEDCKETRVNGHYERLSDTVMEILLNSKNVEVIKELCPSCRHKRNYVSYGAVTMNY